MEHARFSYSPIVDRKPLRLPNGARVALWVIPNIEHFAFDRPSTSFFPGTASFVPDILNYAWRDYGVRVGVWRLMELMERHGVKGTVALNADVCAQYPRVIEEGKKLGWEWMGHGPNNSTLFNKQSEDEERELIRDVLGTITAATGKRPRGWLGPALTESFNTLDLLAAEGIEYVGDWCNDEQPYRMNVKNGVMYSIPYSIEINDIPIFLELKKSPEEFYQILVDQFEGLYRDGERSARVMAICLHPFLIGHPFRAKYLDRALAHILTHDGVWCATGSEIIDWYKTQEA